MPTKVKASTRKTNTRKQAAGNISLNGSLTDRAYQVIKQEILANRLRPGDVLPAERFVRELGLSRTPLREAIQRLEKEGFVEIKPRMGTFVSHLNLREIQDMYQVRRELEGLAARLAAERASPERLAEVESALKRFSPKGKVNYAEMSEAGQSLHRLIIESCGNRVLAGFIRSLHEHFSRFRSLSLDIPEKIMASHAEHLNILDALKRHDGARAEELVHQHFDHAGRSLLDNLLNQPHGSGEIRVTIATGGE